MKYQFIESQRSKFKIRRMCQMLGVSRSAYYAWRNRPKSKREQANEMLLAAIKEEHRLSKNAYGSPRVFRELKKLGVPCSQKRVARLMQANDIVGKSNRKKKYRHYSKHCHQTAPRLLREELDITGPNQVWVSDLTYIQTHKGWLFMCVVLDVYSRKVVGWSMRNDITAELSLAALRMAVSNRKPNQGLIFHSDRGVQYACKSFRDELKRYGFLQSMSRKAYPYDNAAMESFFSSMKREVCDKIFKSREEARMAIFEWVETFYNKRRIHSALEYLTPNEFESHFGTKLCVH